MGNRSATTAHCEVPTASKMKLPGQSNLGSLGMPRSPSAPTQLSNVATNRSTGSSCPVWKMTRTDLDDSWSSSCLEKLAASSRKKNWQEAAASTVDAHLSMSSRITEKLGVT